MQEIKAEKPPQNLKARIISLVAAGLGLLLVVVLILGGALLAGKVWDPSWNPFRSNPIKVIDSAFLNLEKVKTIHSQITLHQSSGMNVTVNGDFNFQNPITPAGSGTVTINQGKDFLDANFIVIDSNTYINVTDASQPLFNSFFQTDLTKKNEGVWIKLPQNYSGEGIAVMQHIFVDISKSPTPLYTFENKLPDAFANGQLLYQYQISINSHVLRSIENVVPSRFLPSGFMNVTKEAQISISNKDNNVYQFSINNIIEIQNSHFNSNVSIQAPEKYKTFQEVFPELQ